jgi:hypothetical protein
MAFRKLPAVADRVETGVVQFGADWPGVFIRGDEALALAGVIDNLARYLPTNAIDAQAMAAPQKFLRGLAEQLRSCHVEMAG